MLKNLSVAAILFAATLASASDLNVHSEEIIVNNAEASEQFDAVHTLCKHKNNKRSGSSSSSSSSTSSSSSGSSESSYAAEISPCYNSAKSYLWKPMLFHGDLLEALQALSIVENLNFPPYLKVLIFIFNDSILSHDFRDYITLNYCKPSDLSPQHQPLFWRSLIFSSFTDFSSISPQHSRQIMEQLQLISSLDENQDQFLFGYADFLGLEPCKGNSRLCFYRNRFVYGLLDDQFDSVYHFHRVAGWGHTTTVKLLLQHRTDVSAIYVGWGLKTASEGGHISTVKLILQSHIDISARYVGSALCEAAQGGHTSIVQILLQYRTYISTYYAGNALEYAAKGDRILIVELLLLSRTDMSHFHVGLVLERAAKWGSTRTVELLLQRCTYISVWHAGLALCEAAQGGHTSTVEILLQYRADISNDNAGKALQYAAKGNRILIVGLLLQSRTDIPAFHVDKALESASQAGHTAIVELLCQHQLNMNR
jgi:ankyrin repeat protein